MISEEKVREMYSRRELLVHEEEETRQVHSFSGRQSGWGPAGVGLHILPQEQVHLAVSPGPGVVRMQQARADPRATGKSHQPGLPGREHQRGRQEGRKSAQQP